MQQKCGLALLAGSQPSAAAFGILPVARLNFPRNIQLGVRFRF
jgi:hypothetical protein